MKGIVFVVLGLICNVVFAADFSDDFNDGDMNGWITLDEPPDLLNDKGPSMWTVQQSPEPGNGWALNQSSNIWGDPPDIIPMGTFAIYDLAEWVNFELSVDVFAQDNDCLGLIWGWKERTNHYRFITMIDPANPEHPTADKAPWSKIEKRLGDESPYYNTIARVKEASYIENSTTHFKLSVQDGVFKVYSNNKLAVEAKDASYSGGKIGFTMIAQSGCYFDNVELVDSGASVSPKFKLAARWASLKVQ